MGDKSLHFHFFYMLYHLLISVWTHGYLSYILGYSPILLLKIFCSSSSSFGHWEPFQLTPVSLKHTKPLLWVILSFFLTFLELLLPGTIWCYRLILYIFCPWPRISWFSKEPHLEILIQLFLGVCLWNAGSKEQGPGVSPLLPTSKDSTAHVPYIMELKRQLKEIMYTKHLEQILAQGTNSVHVSYCLTAWKTNFPSLPRESSQ